MLTFQDFQNALMDGEVTDFISTAIAQHEAGSTYRTAVSADNYDHQMNETIFNYVKQIYTMSGKPVVDFTASNNRIASNFFHRLNTQRNMYLLGNGVTFTKNKIIEVESDGTTLTIDKTKEALGNDFDTDLQKAGYYSLIHGITFGFWNLNKLHVFPVTEFIPFWDEFKGTLRAGIRYWRLDNNKPIQVTVYEEDGYSEYQGFTEKGKTGTMFKQTAPKRAYLLQIASTEVDGSYIVGEENYGSLPIVPYWGSKLKQSTLVGMQRSIDSYDLIRSGFANDLTDCAQIYWLLENAGGMTPSDLARFRDQLMLMHIAKVDNEGKATPYTQEIPYQARKEYLDHIRAGIYEDFGGLDVHTIAAGATNDHIDAAYQPMDEEADDFEYQTIQFIQQILKLIGIDDMPVFKRNRVSNQKEQTDMILSVAEYLDDETILNKLPFISPDEIAGILAKKELQSTNRFTAELERQEREAQIQQSVNMEDKQV